MHGSRTGEHLLLAQPRRSARRDRHGRGLRGPLWLPGPLSPTANERLPTRQEKFDEIVVALVGRLTARVGEALSDVEFGTRDAPQIEAAWSEPVPLGSLVARSGSAARVVLFRRPLETRATDRGELIALVNRQLVELVAELLGRLPEELDDLEGPDGSRG